MVELWAYGCNDNFNQDTIGLLPTKIKYIFFSCLLKYKYKTKLIVKTKNIKLIKRKDYTK